MGIHELAIDNIFRYAGWLSDEAKSIARYVGMVDRHDDDKTDAALQSAENDMTAALLVVKLARSNLAKKRSHVLEAAE